jgi:ankyrin repeat protein
MMTMLLDCGADVNALGYNENKGIAPAIVLAAWEGDVDMLRVLLEAGADPNVAGSAESALYTAIEHTSADAPAPNKVSVLLDNGARHDIFTAAMVGDVEMARAHAAAYPPLLGRRSLKRNRTPLEEAAHYGQDDVATALMELGSQVSTHAAAALGLTEALRATMDADAPQVDARDDSRDTPLMAACTHGWIETARASRRGSGRQRRESLVRDGPDARRGRVGHPHR